MPVSGLGIVPAAGAAFNELTATVRRAVIPSLYVQLYKANPVLAYLLRNAQRAKGGLSQITIPTQNNQFVNWAWAGYDGGFPQPAVQPAVSNAEFNLRLGVIPIPFVGAESIIQSSEVIVNLCKARLADAKTVALQTMAGSIYTNNSASPLIVDSFFNAYDDGTNAATYGGINRTATPTWKSTLKTSAGAVLTRTAFAKLIVQASSLAGGETPDMVITSLADWATLMGDFMSIEQFQTGPNRRYGADDVVNAGFRGLSIADTAVFGDPFCPVGTAWFVNTKYLALFLSEDAPFAFSGFYSAIPNMQLASIGVVIVAYDVVVAKPISGMQVTGITGAAF
jgi:hypothetical protein